VLFTSCEMVYISQILPNPIKTTHQWKAYLFSFHVMYKSQFQKKFTILTVVMKSNISDKDLNHFFAPDYKHIYFCCKVGHFNMQVYGIESLLQRL